MTYLTAMPYNSLLEILTYRAQYQRDCQAYIFLQNGETESESLTYGQLDRQARLIAAYLLPWRGERALLLYPSGLEFIKAFFGCLFAGVVAVPVYPPRRNHKLSRLLSIANDAQAKIALTTTSILADIEKRWEEEAELAQLKLIATDTIERNPQEFVPKSVTPESLAFLQYTSGSTGTPKGVMVTHGNIIHNQQMIQTAFGHSSKTIFVGWLPLFHDMGLIGNVLQPMYLGIPCILMPPVAFLQKPICWLKAISKYRATTSGGPNFAYDLCVSKICQKSLSNLDLSSWDLAFNGAEPLQAKTLEKFTKKFSVCGFNDSAFYPCYGMAETTLFITGINKNQSPVIQGVKASNLEENLVVGTEIDSLESRILVGCGHPYMDTNVIIVNPNSLTRCSQEQVGEIWVSSPSVAAGYWNHSEATKETFQAYIKDSREGPFLRTGDLGFLKNGELVVTGRLKDLIIIRGRNYYPQDIELTIENSHHSLRSTCSAAFTVEIEGEECLVIACEVERTHRRKLNIDEVVKEIKIAVSIEHQLEVYGVLLLKTGSIPKTSSGKIQRHACKQNFLKNSLNLVGSWQNNIEINSMMNTCHLEINHQKNFHNSDFKTVDEIETWLTNKIAQAFQIPIFDIDLKQPFSTYGLDSVKAISIANELEEWLEISIDPMIVYDFPIPKLLANYLGQKVSQKAEENNALVTQQPVIDILPEYYNFNLNKNYLNLQQKIQKLEFLKDGVNPYFNINENISNNTIKIEGQEFINYSSYNYLGLSGNAQVNSFVKQSIDLYGTSASASRIISGEKPIHRQLEREIADIIGVSESIVFVGGHATNVTTISHLFGEKDLILCDYLSHNSISQGCSFSGAKILPFAHNNWQELDHLLATHRHNFQQVLVVIEGIYSADGDIPDLPKFIEVKKRHKVFLMIDEAHSIGVLGKQGRGIGEHYRINVNDVDIWMGTLSKSFASCGGYIAGNSALIEYLKYTAPGFVYSVGMSPANTAAALAAIQVLKAQPELIVNLHARAKLFLKLAQKYQLNTGLSQNTPIIPIIVGDSLKCIKLSQALFRRGINVQPMIYPSVPENMARLRFFITSKHTEEQINLTIDAVVQELEKLQRKKHHETNKSVLL